VHTKLKQNAQELKQLLPSKERKKLLSDGEKKKKKLIIIVKPFGA
jgi:hypothetical protein